MPRYTFRGLATLHVLRSETAPHDPPGAVSLMLSPRLPVSSCRHLPSLALLVAVALTCASGTARASVVQYAFDEYFETGVLPGAVQQLLAERFAPELLFHPQEEFFPTSPLFPTELEPEAWDAPDDAVGSTLSRLGTARMRTERYRGLSLEEKAGVATVYYRAYPARRGGTPRVVIEYWLYYVHNIYRVRGGFLPFWVDGSHPNDLEHIHLVLRPTEEGLVPEEVWSSSHQGIVPANRYTFGDSEADAAFGARPRFLVERGSHALAPDVDGDGIFTPGLDGHSGYRFLWGIRDRGIARARYSRSYLDADRAVASIVFVPDVGVARGDDVHAYQLRPVDEISTAFDALNLSTAERKELFEVARHWVRRAFGGDNGSSGKLLVPPVRTTASASIGIPHIASTERGFLVGGTFKLQEQGVYVGARYAYLHGTRFVPDLILQVDAVQTTRQAYTTTHVLLSHPIDASTKVMAGKALVTDSWRFDNRQWDWYAGVELTLGSMRISGASRSWGPITNLSREFRLSYFF
jgi:hypothetical protein